MIALRAWLPRIEWGRFGGADLDCEDIEGFGVTLQWRGALVELSWGTRRRAQALRRKLRGEMGL